MLFLFLKTRTSDSLELDISPICLSEKPSSLAVLSKVDDHLELK